MPATVATVDFTAYFERIGWRGRREPTLAVLRELQQCHTRAIPFENLDPLLGVRVRLDLPSLLDKLVARGRGGYCYEHNILFAHALMQLGFTVTPLIARVLWGREGDEPGARTHMLLSVESEGGAWLADTGFGAVTPSVPLRLKTGEAQPTPLETFRLVDAARGAFDLEVASSGRWRKVYRFDLQPAEWIDYEVANWYTSTWPDSIFVTQLMASRVLERGRLTLLGSRLTERGTDGEARVTSLGSAAELARCLHTSFGIALAGVDVAALFERLHASPARD